MTKSATAQAPVTAIAFAHRRAYRLSGGTKTYAQHVVTCAACTEAKAATR